MPSNPTVDTKVASRLEARSIGASKPRLPPPLGALSGIALGAQLEPNSSAAGWNQDLENHCFGVRKTKSASRPDGAIA